MLLKALWPGKPVAHGSEPSLDNLFPILNLENGGLAVTFAEVCCGKRFDRDGLGESHCVGESKITLPSRRKPARSTSVLLSVTRTRTGNGTCEEKAIRSYRTAVHT